MISNYCIMFINHGAKRPISDRRQETYDYEGDGNEVEERRLDKSSQHRLRVQGLGKRRVLQVE
jgi:hypothetical protein